MTYLPLVLEDSYRQVYQHGIGRDTSKVYSIKLSQWYKRYKRLEWTNIKVLYTPHLLFAPVPKLLSSLWIFRISTHLSQTSPGNEVVTVQIFRLKCCSRVYLCKCAKRSRVEYQALEKYRSSEKVSEDARHFATYVYFLLKLWYASCQIRLEISRIKGRWDNSLVDISLCRL